MATKNKILVGLILLMLGIFSVFAYLIYQAKQNPASTPTPALISETAKTYPVDLTGKIYLTLKEEDSQKQGIYYFDLDKNELVEVYTSKECEIIGGGLNSTGDKMAYTSNCNQGDGNYQVFVYDLKQNSSQQITQTSGKLKKEATWSGDDSEIVFVKSNEIEGTLGEWAVYKTGMKGDEKFIASNSQNPFFGKNKNEVLASTEGFFYLYDIGNETGKNLLYLDSSFLADNQFDISNNRDRLVFLTDISEKKRIENYNIGNWDNFDIVRNAEMEISDNESVNNLKFHSENDKYVIGKKIDSNSEQSLMVYYLKEKQQHQIINFDNSYNLIEVNDWR